MPTPVHRAQVELIFAAVVARQHASRTDRHPFFGCFGRTLLWKTSLGSFVCHALGLDPAIQVVDCGSESGKSLSFRRSTTGTLVYKRELLDAPFVVLDEFLTADPSVRAAITPLLSGRLVVPYENESLTVRPVFLLTANAREKATIEDRLGLSAPLIRRAIIADFDRVPIPDLATMGERALVAARTHGVLAVPAPAVDCSAFHDPIVELTRALLVTEAHARVDVEVVVNLATGMSAFVPEPVDAIAQVAHGLGIVLETLGWTRPGWIEAVLRFSLQRRPGSGLAKPAAASLPPSGGHQEFVGDPASAQSLPLQVPRTGRRDAAVPELALDDAFKARLIWFAVDGGLPLQVALGRLLDFYLYWRRDKATVGTLYAVIKLAEALGITEVGCETIKEYLVAKTQLAKFECTFEDFPEALKLIEVLGELPENWTWDRARTAIQGVAKTLVAGIDSEQIEAFLARHQRLIEYGFDENLAEAIAKILAEAGAIGERRDLVIRVLVETAGAAVDRDALEHQHHRLRQEIVRLQAERVALGRRVKALTTRVTNLETVAAAAMRDKAHLDAECQARRDDLDALHSLRALIFGRITEIGSFLDDVDRLRERRRQGTALDATYAMLAADARAKVIEFFRQIVAEAQGA